MSRVAFFLSALDGGGAEKIMLNLARGFVEQGLTVDLVLVKAQGAYLSSIPAGVQLINLGDRRLILSGPALAQYLRDKQPVALLSALEDANVMALWTRQLTKVPTRVVVTVHNTLSREAQNATKLKRRIAPYLARMFYGWADAIIAVSQGAAEDLVRLGLPRDRIEIVYNPVVTPEVLTKLHEPVDHPWFLPDSPPVVLGVGRLEKQKDFVTLIRAFAQVRQQRAAKLIILGEGSDRAALEKLIRELRLQEDVALPGFVSNPYAYMANAAVFVLSSLFEGLPTVLIEAMAAGTTVVSTDCESGPREILADDRYGTLVPVGNVEKLAIAIASALDHPVDAALLQQRAADFSLDQAVASYRQVLGVTEN